MHVSEVGETDKCVFTVVFLSSGAEEHQGYLPNPTAFVRRQLELCLSTHFGERKHLAEERETLDLDLLHY